MTTWTELRSATRDTLVAAGVGGGVVDVSRFAPIQAVEGTTYVRVYLRSGRYAADGHQGTGEPTFNRERRLMISVYRAAGAADAIDDDLDADIDAVLAALLTNAEWVGLTDGVGSIDIDYDAKEDGEFRSVEATISIEVFDWVHYLPVIADHFETAAIRTSLGQDEPGTGADLTLPTY